MTDAPDCIDPGSPEFGARLDLIHDEICHMVLQPWVGKMALGAAHLDHELWRMGHEWWTRHGDGRRPEGTDLYLATQVAKDGGHTAVIGDLVRALGRPESSRLIITNIWRQNDAPLSPEIVSRTGLPAENIQVLGGPTLTDRMWQAMQAASLLRPSRLFMVQHPNDPAAPLLARPEMTGRSFLAHFSDAQPSLGLHIPGIQIMDFNPNARAFTRSLGLDSELLPLTCPDPGPRPQGFLLRGKLTTATSGRDEKFTRNHSFSYPETVGVILRATGGWHVHIGPLPDTSLAQITGVLLREGIAQDRFIHVPWVACIATALWEHQCDVYFSSYPIDGARTNTEVLASATPHLRHLRGNTSVRADDPFAITGGLVWRTWEDLADTLKAVAHEDVLRECSLQMHRVYDRLHHPDVFRACLQDIIAGRGGMEDPLGVMREHHMQRALARALTTHTQSLWRDSQSRLRDSESLHHDLHEVRKIQGDLQAARLHLLDEVTKLKEKRAKLQTEIEKLKARLKKQKPRASWQQRLRDWWQGRG
jgi:uncharacterized small protein (DUF1192 family)